MRRVLRLFAWSCLAVAIFVAGFGVGRTSLRMAEVAPPAPSVTQATAVPTRTPRATPTPQPRAEALSSRVARAQETLRQRTAAPIQTRVPPKTIAGRGTKVSDTFTLPAATYRVTMTVRTNLSRGQPQNFIVWLESLTSGDRALLANEISGSGEWSVLQRVGAGHRFALEVDATGRWEITFTPMR